MPTLPAPWGQISQPKFCGECGKELTVTESKEFDRQTGKPIPSEPIWAACPDGHEQWGATYIGTWTQSFEEAAEA